MNEVYKKESILAASPLCPVSGCSKSGTQCVEISKPVVLSPTAVVGTITTACQGNPVVECENNADGTACTVTLTQRVCVTIPVTFGVAMDESSPGIQCAGGC